MAIVVISLNPNETIPPSLAEQGVFGMAIFSGIVEFVFNGDNTGDVTRDTLSFTVGPVNLGSNETPIASCTMSPASFAYDGVVSNALWAVDSASVPAYASFDRGSGTGTLEVVGNLAVRGLNGILLRVNYTVFYGPQVS